MFFVWTYRNIQFKQNTLILSCDPEAVFVNIYAVQESIPPAWESIPGLLKGFTNTG